jgi:hypothetical protein
MEEKTQEQEADKMIEITYNGKKYRFISGNYSCGWYCESSNYTVSEPCMISNILRRQAISEGICSPSAFEDPSKKKVYAKEGRVKGAPRARAKKESEFDRMVRLAGI